MAAVESETEICNLAISHLAIGKEIANVETENSNEANACRRFLSMARLTTLRDFPWPFATKIASPTLVEEDPNDEWNYSFRYPSDCLKVRRILSGTRNDSRSTRIPYKVGKDDSGLLLFIDEEEPQIEYTEDVEDPTFFPSDFVMALSFRLAAYIAPRLTAGDANRLGERALSYYQGEIAKARTTALNEEQVDLEVDSEFIRARE